MISYVIDQSHIAMEFLYPTNGRSIAVSTHPLEYFALLIPPSLEERALRHFLYGKHIYNYYLTVITTLIVSKHWVPKSLLFLISMTL